MELKSYKRFIDAEMLNILGQLDSPSRILDFLYLGSEWNASNLEELTGNEVANILNVAREIDNFFPGLVNYYNVREDDVESADMMKYWHETSKFLAQVRRVCVCLCMCTCICMCVCECACVCVRGCVPSEELRETISKGQINDLLPSAPGGLWVTD